MTAVAATMMTTAVLTTKTTVPTTVKANVHAAITTTKIKTNEMTVIKEKFDKKDINALPRETFNGRIITILTENDAQKAVDYLLTQSMLGVDTETRPSFRKGTVHQVALLQVSTHDTCFLFRLNRTGITDSIKRLLEDEKTAKVGLSLHDDIALLRKRREFTPGNFIEIQNEIKNIGISDMSLQKIYANIFHKKISKGQQLTNWEADILTDAQKLYAATDAWACIMIHDELKRLVETGNYEFIPATPAEAPKAES